MSGGFRLSAVILLWQRPRNKTFHFGAHRLSRNLAEMDVDQSAICPDEQRRRQARRLVVPAKLAEAVHKDIGQEQARLREIAADAGASSPWFAKTKVMLLFAAAISAIIGISRRQGDTMWPRG
ncbi:hypothetical protein [Mesorhizobium sp. 10J20-29]